MRQAPEFIHAIEQSGVGQWLRSSVIAMPIVESAHVLCVTLLFGTILVVDLRLLGWLDRNRPVTVVEHEMLPITWTAFVGAVMTGLMFFSANATTYWFNTAFRIKMLTILLAGVNMAVFQLITFRGVAVWNSDAPTPRAARIAGALSILLWVAVIALGRTIGFTKGYDFSVPTGVDFDFGSGP